MNERLCLFVGGPLDKQFHAVSVPLPAEFSHCEPEPAVPPLIESCRGASAPSLPRIAECRYLLCRSANGELFYGTIDKALVAGRIVVWAGDFDEPYAEVDYPLGRVR